MAKDNNKKPKIKVIGVDELPSEVKEILDNLIGQIKKPEPEPEPEQAQKQETLECEEHLIHYKQYLGVCFDKNNEKIGSLHINDNGRFESFMKEAGNVDDGFIRKIIIYKALEAVVDTTKYEKGKKKKPSKIKVVAAPQ